MKKNSEFFEGCNMIWVPLIEIFLFLQHERCTHMHRKVAERRRLHVFTSLELA